jgi:uncharacterized protein (DUF58 family)
VIDAFIKQATRIPLRLRRPTDHARLGQQRSRQRGGGLAFDRITPYQPGDVVSRINWAATARHGGTTPLVNVYHEEKDFTVMLLVDLSASMRFGSTRLTKRARAAEVCASLVYSALVEHNRVGFLGLTAEVEHFLPPSQAPAYQRLILEHIMADSAAPTPVNFAAATTALERCLPQPALIFLLSDFLLQDTQPLESALSRLSRRHEVIALHILDPLERMFPIGTARLVMRDLETQQVQAYSLTRANQRRMAEQTQARHTHVQLLFQRLRVPYLSITPQSNYHHDLSRLFVNGYGRVSA